MAEETETIVARSSLSRDTSSPFFGRYCLRGEQVSPDYNPAYDVYLKLRSSEDQVRALCENLDPPLSLLFRVFDDKDFRNRLQTVYHPFDATDRLLVFCQSSDYCYVAEENLHAAFSLFAPHVEDGHFFVYSLGEGDDRWVHEYTIASCRLSFQRHLLQANSASNRRKLYRKLPRGNSPDWARFKSKGQSKRASKRIESAWRRHWGMD